MLGNLLIDTNILFSLFLDQNDYESTEKLFTKIEELNIRTFIADFAVYTVCIILSVRNEKIYLEKILNFLRENKNIRIYKLNLEEILETTNLKIELDFDDKVQYYLSKKKKLTLVSFDKDFDGTGIKRLTPKEALRKLEFF